MSKRFLLLGFLGLKAFNAAFHSALLTEDFAFVEKSFQYIGSSVKHTINSCKVKYRLHAGPPSAAMALFLSYCLACAMTN